MICRDPLRRDRERSRIAEVATGAAPVLLLADLSSQADIRSVATEIGAFVAASPELDGVSGHFYMHGRELALKPAALDPDVAKRLWSVSEQLCGIEPGGSTVNIVAARAGRCHDA